MYLSVKDVKPLEDYKLLLVFENGEKKIFDVKPYLETGKFRELKNKTLFNSVKVCFDSIEWDNHLDFDPEILYEKSYSVSNLPVNIKTKIKQHIMTATIGGFDGMHLGHQALIKKADIIIIIEKGSNLTPGTDRCDYTKLPCKFYNLDDVKHLEADEFIYILKDLNITKIIVGSDFRFGKNRRGDIGLLKHHFEVEVIDEVKIDGIGVHSKIIREFIKNGEIKKANRFLGHIYKIKGKQVKGQGLGAKELVATVNINLIKSYLLPKSGVYITLTNKQPSLTFIGIRSTDNNFSIETHILNPSQLDNFTISEPITIEFLDFLRENRKFENLADLKNQIQKDIKTALSRLDKNHNR